jgi:outer membrane lipoprotein SlyB
MENAPGKMHPLMMVAAISVTVASLAAIGIMTGVIPGRKAEAPAPEVAPIVAQAPATAAQTTPPPATAPVVAPPEPAPAAIGPAEPPAKPVSKAAKPVAIKKAPKTESVPHEPPPPPAAATSAAPTAPAAAPVPAAPPICRECGTVESVREVTQKGEGTGLGAVAGGVVGGVLGHQVGAGRGKDLATVAGAVGGAVAGHQIEKYQRKTTRYEITVRMDDGTVQTINAESQPSWRGGDRVKVTNGTIVPTM